MNVMKQGGYEFGDFRLDVAKRRLLRAGEPVPLIAKAFDLLLALIEHRDRVLEKDELLKLVWPETIVEESNLTQNVFVLRKALGEAPNDHRYIVTVPRRGYRFVAEVKELRAEAAPAAPQYRARAVIEVSAVRSIAVLPFKQLRPQSEDEYLGLGLADALITQLSNLRRLITRPTSSVLKYAAPTVDLLAAGRELAVDALLDGHVQKAQDRLRLTVQLIGVADGAPLWAGKFDAEFTDIFAVQDTISEQVARALALKLNEAEQRRLTKHHTDNAEAYQLYLQGRYYDAKFTAAGFNKALDCFKQALALDPRFALAYVGLAEVYFHGATFYFPPNEALPRMREAAAQAAVLDDTLAEAHTMLAAAQMNLDWDWAGAEHSYQRALELNPGLAAAHHWYGWLLVLLGRHDESIAELQQALRLDPLSQLAYGFLGSALYFARRFDESLAHAQRAVEVEPDYWMAHWGVACAYERLGQWPEAIAACQRALALSDAPMIKATLAMCYAGAGERRAAQQLLAELQRPGAQHFVAPYYLALICAALGETAQAFAWLDQAVAARDESVPLLRVDPRLDGLRADPRLADLLRRIGL
jgi:DNA-binding winged helix-turn-helix (wHTH) protein/Tfp pilus assembly protein PilF